MIYRDLERGPGEEKERMATSAQYVLLLSKTRRSELFFLDAGFLLEMTLRRVFKGESRYGIEWAARYRYSVR